MNKTAKKTTLLPSNEASLILYFINLPYAVKKLI